MRTPCLATTISSVLGFGLGFGACATAGAPDTPDAAPPPSLHAQLARPVRLVVDPTASTGDLTAREHAGTSWTPAHVALAIDAGELRLERRGETALSLRALEVDVAPIALPMLPGDAHLTGVALRLAAPAMLGVTWQDADHAVALATLDFELAWSLTASGGTVPLGTQHLAAVPIAITLGREGAAATAAVALVQPGELWSWADLVALDDLALELPARTASPVIE